MHELRGYSGADLVGAPSDTRSTIGYCVFVGDDLVSWRGKKPSVVAWSSAESEYRAMAQRTCELLWLKTILKEVGFVNNLLLFLFCDDQAALHIDSNSVFMRGQNTLR